MKRSFKGLAAISGAVLTAAVFLSFGLSAGETAKHVRIIYTNDTVGYTEPCG